MKEKEKLIIDSALKFFAQKGYSSTSVQEIANDCGISKGAFYLYFKSKDSLLYTILRYYYEELIIAFEEIDKKIIPPREKLTEQMTFMFEHSLKHRDLIIMQTREQAIPLNDSIKELLLQMQATIQQNTLKRIYDIYGEASKKYLLDLLILQDGFIQSYLKTLLINQISIPIPKLSNYLLKRLDSIFFDLKETDEDPLVSDNFLNQLIRKPKINFMENNIQVILDTLHSIRKKMETSSNKEELEISLDILTEEINSPEPRIPIIKGMLSNLSEHLESREEQKIIADYYKIL